MGEGYSGRGANWPATWPLDSPLYGSAHSRLVPRGSMEKPRLRLATRATIG